MEYTKIKNKSDIENVNNKIIWAMDYINEYTKSGRDFDPFMVLSGNIDKKEKLYIETCNFLTELENVINNYNSVRRKYL